MLGDFCPMRQNLLITCLAQPLSGDLGYVLRLLP